MIIAILKGVCADIPKQQQQRGRRMSKEFMKVYHMPFKAQEIKDDNLTNFRLQMDQAFEEMTKSFAEQQDEMLLNYLYEKYKDTKVSDVWVLSKPDFEKFLLEMLPKWKEPKQYVDELKLVEKKLNALNLLMQELGCKDFAELRKYARCGYQTFRNAKGANYDNIIIDEAVIPSEALECLEKVYSRLPQWDLSRNVDQCNIIKQALLKQQEKKTYLKWEDLEFGKTTHKLKAKMNDSLYRIEWYIDGLGANVVSLYKYITKDYLVYCVCIKDNSHNFFNDLHLERVEE